MDYWESYPGEKGREGEQTDEADPPGSERDPLCGWVPHRFASLPPPTTPAKPLPIGELEKVTNKGEGGGDKGKHDARRLALPAGAEIVRSEKLACIPALRSGLHAFGQDISAFYLPPGALLIEWLSALSQVETKQSSCQLEPLGLEYFSLEDSQGRVDHICPPPPLLIVPFCLFCHCHGQAADNQKKTATGTATGQRQAMIG